MKARHVFMILCASISTHLLSSSASAQALWRNSTGNETPLQAALLLWAGPLQTAPDGQHTRDQARLAFDSLPQLNGQKKRQPVCGHSNHCGDALRYTS